MWLLGTPLSSRSRKLSMRWPALPSSMLRKRTAGAGGGAGAGTSAVARGLAVAVGTLAFCSGRDRSAVLRTAPPVRILGVPVGWVRRGRFPWLMSFTSCICRQATSLPKIACSRPTRFSGGASSRNTGAHCAASPVGEGSRSPRPPLQRRPRALSRPSWPRPGCPSAAVLTTAPPLALSVVLTNRQIPGTPPPSRCAVAQDRLRVAVSVRP